MICWRQPRLSTDLVVDAIEITQSMQDLNNSVPLVEGKRTFVRVYVHSTGGIYPTTATLKVEAGALNQTLLPIAPGGPLINVRPSYNSAAAHAMPFCSSCPLGLPSRMTSPSPPRSIPTCAGARATRRDQLRQQHAH